MKAPWFFKDEVHTCLPYRETKVDWSPVSDDFNHMRIMCGDPWVVIRVSMDGLHLSTILIHMVLILDSLCIAGGPKQ